jgi:hypothetical protein
MLYKVATVLGIPVAMLVKDDGPASEEAELVAAWQMLNEAEQRMVLHLTRRLSGNLGPIRAAGKPTVSGASAGQGAPRD